MGKGQRSKNAAGAATLTAQKEQKKSKLKGVLIGIAVAVVLLALVGLTVFNLSQDQGWFEGNEVVMSTENYSVNQGMFAYFFRESYMNVYNTYYSIFGDSTSSYIDTSKSLKEQEYSGGDYDTWYDYILDQTKKTVNEYLILCEDARAAGIALGDEERAEVNSEMSEIKDAAKTAGYSSAGDYIRAAFGVGVNEAKIKTALEIEHLATKYAQKIANETDVSDEAVEAVYNEDSNTYDKVSYLTYTFKADDLLPNKDEEGDDYVEPTEEEIDAAVETIRKSSEELAAVKSEDEFKDYVKNYLMTVLGKDEDAADTEVDGLLKKDASYSESNDAMKWAFDAKAGDTTVIEGSDASTDAVYFLVTEKHRDDNDGYVAVRHVLFGIKDEENKDQPDGSEYGYDDPAAKSKEVYDKWVEEGATADAIAELAAEYSTDSSKTNGGLIENVSKGRFVEPFNSWLFDEEHKEGDHTLLETQYGWHIAYFVSKGEPQWKTTIISKLKNDAYTSVKEAATEKYPVTVHDELIKVDA